MGLKQLFNQQAQTQDSPDWEKPPHIPDQRGFIHDLFDTDETVWMIFLDGGRYDLFDQLRADYFTGSLRRVWNGGVGYTGDWAMRNLEFDFGNRGVFSWLPFREHDAATYDGRNWFEVAPDIAAEKSVEQRLTVLGYQDAPLLEPLEVGPETVNEYVLNQQAVLDGGVVRYLKPHPPFKGLEEITSTSRKVDLTRHALESGELTYGALTTAYIDTYRLGFEAAAELIPQLDGRVVLTSDHGTCLYCGQLFHGRNYEPHDHLTVVPWFEVGAVR